MRATSARRRARVNDRVTRVGWAPLKDRAADSVVHAVQEVPLTPGMEVNEAMAKRHGLVTRQQIADRCTVTLSAISAWEKRPEYPKSVAVLGSCDMGGTRMSHPVKVWRASEVEAWIRLGLVPTTRRLNQR